MLNELSDTALIVEHLGLNVVIITEVSENYSYARIKESLLSQSLKENFVIINSGLGENKGVSLVPVSVVSPITFSSSS